jgi:hypothetical protein
MRNIPLDGETADRITALTMSTHLGWIREDLASEKTHPEDRERYQRLADAMDLLLKEYFQGPL